ncbi:MAG TPA: N-formylglutamate amidohydrolase [Pseudomonadales bacterium]
MPREQRFLITCEHGGNRIPARYAILFAGQSAVLQSHRGWDPGALTLARSLAKLLDAPLIASQTSRLLVDLNRSEHHPKLFSAMTDVLQDDARNRILDEHYRPYRDDVEAAGDAIIDADARIVHISVHSFVPVLDGKTRRADIGLLYDPRRTREAALCNRWIMALGASLPDLEVRRNYPYRGDADGLTTALRRRYRAADYIGIEIELNQRLVARPETFRRVRDAVGQAIAGVSSSDK